MFKQLIRNILIVLHIPVTKNIHYDILTRKLMKKVLSDNSNCIDVGGFKGEIMSEILRYSPGGMHLVFEPIPDQYRIIEGKFRDLENVEVKNMALSDKKGTAIFNYVPDFPAYSGLKKREYPDKSPEIKQIEVRTDRLDSVVPDDMMVDFIKIDVEGAEYLVLKGAKKILQQCSPVIIFEFGLGASEYYGTTPEKMFALFEQCEYGIWLIDDYLRDKAPMKLASFSKQYNEKLNYYFVAGPAN